MSFIHFSPLGSREPYFSSSSRNVEDIIWEELTLLRHLDQGSIGYDSKQGASFIDQAKIYFLDSWKSNWRSSGLLYYYSFLNLQKAHLLSKGLVSESEIKQTSLYHGITSGPPNSGLLPEFLIRIYPTKTPQRINVFASVYEAFTGNKWPFNTEIELPLKFFLPYCRDIGSELYEIYKISPKIDPARSILRNDGLNSWFEMIVPTHVESDSLNGNISGTQLKLSTIDTPTDIDLFTWQSAHQIYADEFAAYHILRGNGIKIDSSIENSYRMVSDICISAFKLLSIASPASYIDRKWNLIQKIDLHGITMPWHPVLSDYLVSFALSNLLRYHPHIIDDIDKNSYIARSWVNQSALSVIQYTLLAMTKPPKRLVKH